MATTTLRRSSRLKIYDSNGRDYLADSIGWSRGKLEDWITAPTVRPHLQLWYRICVAEPRRFNDAVDWINTGEHGYFYNPSDLEEDLLLACLAGGNPGEGSSDVGLKESDEVSYASQTSATSNWITQELWARTAWRIVHANRSEGHAFAQYAESHVATCYAFVIDLLCVAFHSLAFRKHASVYERLIMGHVDLTGQRTSLDPKFEQTDDECSLMVSISDSETETSNQSDSMEDVGWTPATSDDDGDMGEVIEVKMVRKTASSCSMPS